MINFFNCIFLSHFLNYIFYRNVDFSEILQPDLIDKQPRAIYDLIANIVHDGEPGSGKGTYRTHILHRVSYCISFSHTNELVFFF